MAKCKLIATTKSNVDGINNIQEFIAFCARISNPYNQYNHATSSKLLNYLIRNKHWSPFEMASLCVEIETTRDIAHQIIRHRSFSFQEFSQRYADPINELGFATREARLQDHQNRQNSLPSNSEILANKFKAMQSEIIRVASHYYREAIELGVAKEVARAMLPEGLTVTRLYMTGNVRSWIHYLQLRTSKETQLEHREVAQLCMDAIAPEFPMITSMSPAASIDEMKEYFTVGV